MFDVNTITASQNNCITPFRVIEMLLIWQGRVAEIQRVLPSNTSLSLRAVLTKTTNKTLTLQVKHILEAHLSHFKNKTLI